MVTPVPIPNTAVKHPSADDTWLETTWESRNLPDLYQDLMLIAWGFVLRYNMLLLLVVSGIYQQLKPTQLERMNILIKLFMNNDVVWLIEV